MPAPTLCGAAPKWLGYIYSPPQVCVQFSSPLGNMVLSYSVLLSDSSWRKGGVAHASGKKLQKIDAPNRAWPSITT